MARRCDRHSVTITDSASTTGTVDMAGTAGGIIFVPPGSGLTTLAFHQVNIDADGTRTVATGAINAATASDVVAGGSIEMPSQCFACEEVAIVGSGTGTVKVTMKS